MEPEKLNIEQFEIVRRVTLPFVMIPNDGTPFYLKFETKIEADTSQFSERMRKSRKDGEQPQQKPVDIARVVNLQTGEVGRLLVHEVLKSNLNEAYPSDGYVGLYFKIEKTKAQGKRYFNFNITEIRMKHSEQAKTAPTRK